MDAQIASSAIAIVGTLGGALIGAFSQREGKRISRLEQKVEQYRVEIIARIALERAAMSWVYKENLANSLGAAQKELRDKAEAMCTHRPSLTPSDVAPNNLTMIANSE
ncbi:MAG: hypothetical protein ABSF16_05345 [Terracidiphilus sp.]|jgi:hypothetical protein